jgi:hypothetical protein
LVTLRFDGKKDLDRRAAVERGEWPIDDAALRAGKPIFIPDMDAYRKTTLTYAARIDQPFEVDTLEGLHTGNAGDYLAVGPHGEMYPIDAAVFADSYESVED